MYRRVPSILAAIALSTLLASPTLAQATRTWVSGIGDDANLAPSAAGSASSQLYVRDSIIRNNNGAASGGIHVRPGSNVSTLAQIDNTSLLDNRFGLKAES